MSRTLLAMLVAMAGVVPTAAAAGTIPPSAPGDTTPATTAPTTPATTPPVTTPTTAAPTTTPPATTTPATAAPTTTVPATTTPATGATTSTTATSTTVAATSTTRKVITPSASETAASIVKSIDPVQGGGFTAPNTFATGALVRYKLLLQCSSLSVDCGVGTVTDVLDPNLEFVQVIVPQTPMPVTSAAVGQTVTVKLGTTATPWPDGNQLEVVLVARVRGTAPAGDIPNSASVAITNGDGGTSGPVVINVPPPTPQWGVKKTGPTSGNAVLGEPVPFRIDFTLPTMFGNVDVTSGTLVDTYPAGAVVLDAAGGTVDTVNHTITWSTGPMSSSTAVNCSATGTNCTKYFPRDIVLMFPAATFASVPTATNLVNAHLVFADGSTGDPTGQATVSFVAGTPKNSVQKTGPTSTVTGAAIQWRLYDPNNGNTTLTNVVMTEIFPAGVTDFSLYRQYTGYQPVSPADVVANFEYQDASGTWVPWFVHDKSNPAYDNSWTTRPMPAGALGVRVIVPTLLPGQVIDINLNGTVTGTPPDVIHNCLTSDSDTTTLATSCLDTAISQPFSTLSVVKGHQFLNNDAAQTSLIPGEEFRFIVSFNVSGPTAVSQVDIADLLPPQFEYVATECWGSGANGYYKSWEPVIFAMCNAGTGLPNTPQPTVAAGASGTELHWLATAPNGGTFPFAPYFGIVFRVRVKAATSNANYTNVQNGIIHDANVATTCYLGYQATAVPDTTDLNGNGNTTESKCRAVDAVQVRQAAIGEISKWVKGDIGQNVAESTGLPSASCPDNGGYTRYPCVATVTPGGAFDYLFQATNTGNVVLTDYWIYDILPFPGDTGVSGALAGAQRGTEWDPVLTGPITSSAGGVVEYSSSSNPCRSEVAPVGASTPWPAGCTNDWTTSFSAGAKAFRVHLFADGAEWTPGTVVTLHAPMQAPATAPASTMSPTVDLSVAWNSVAHQADRMNADGTTYPLLPSEPRKVGVIIPFPPISIGDYVWIDTNRDGVQGPAATEPPVKDVKVELFDSSGNSLGTTTTDANGFYSFTDLYVGTAYKLVFTAPDGYSWTTQNAGTDDAVDSDVNPADGTVTFTTPLVTGTNSATAPDVPIYDGGLVQYNLKLTKELTSAAPYLPGSTVTFRLTPHNDGPTDALAGWTVTDILPAGLSPATPTAISGTGYSCNQATLTCTSDSALKANTDGNPITVTATIDATFTNGTLHNVAFVAPVSTETVPETNPLVTPTTTTNTTTTPTDNDAQAELTVSNKVSIGDYVWLDNDRDGVQGTAAAEPPVKDVKVELFDSAGTFLRSTTTDANGFYSFTDLALSTAYKLVFTPPPGYTWTQQNAGTNDAVDSDVDPTDGTVLFTTPAVGGTNSAIAPDVPTYDGGLLQYNLKLTKELTASAPFYAGSTVTFSLTPHNDGPAVALAGWTVTDILPAGLSPVTPTAISGTGYTCVQATLTCTSDSELAPNTDGGVITVTATINAGFTGTLHNVAYVAPVGSDTLPELNPLVVPTTTTDTSTTPTDNDSQASLTVASLVSIGDYVWFDNNRDGIQGDPAVEKPVEGVVVNLYAADGFTLVATTTTDDKGFYSFVDLVPDATYVVEFVKPAGTTFTQQTAGSDRAVDSNPDPATGRVTITAPASGVNSPTTPDDPTIDAGLITYNLKLTKALTSHGPYYVGATVTYTLTPHNDGPATAVPGWSVTDVLPTQLTATEMTGTGYTCDLPSLTCTSPTELAPGQDGPVITLTATVNQLFIGQLKNVAYVAPNPEDGVPETNPLGTPPDNTTETKTSPTDNDDEQVIDVVSLVSIGDYVWMDNNRDGQQGPAATEPPVPGVKVELFDSSGTSIGTTTTDANGFYSFVDLVPGASYKLVFTRPDGFSWTARNLGAKATDSDVDANGEVTFTAPASGVNSPTTPDDPTIDAGLVQYNLTLDKKLTSAGPYYPGSTATFQLTPHNDGPSDAIGGWSVTDVLPKGLTATAISGAGYTCTLSTLTCVNAASLAGGADGGPITVTATVDALFAGVLHNVAYVAPNPSDSVAETNPLGTPPTSSTQTSLTPTDNDSEAEITVSVPPTTSTTLVSPGTGSIATTTTVTPTTGPLPSTGSNVGTPLLAGVVLSLGGLGLLLISRRRRRHARS